MKIVFFGDSITGSDRNPAEKTDLGSGYVKIVAGKLRLLYPDQPPEIVNRGVGGDRTTDLLLRIDEDVIAEQPDCVVLQVGINDVWRRFTEGEATPTEQFRENYEQLIAGIKETGAKLILVQPYVLKMEDKQRFRPYVDAINAVIREIAEREKLPLVPMDEIFSGATIDIKPKEFSTDGVHPTHRGCRYIADFVIKELKKIIS